MKFWDGSKIWNISNDILDLQQKEYGKVLFYTSPYWKCNHDLLASKMNLWTKHSLHSSELLLECRRTISLCLELWMGSPSEMDCNFSHFKDFNVLIHDSFECFHHLTNGEMTLSLNLHQFNETTLVNHNCRVNYFLCDRTCKICWDR